jgi:dCMP deaminase
MDWEDYWFNMCKTVASNSKCLSRKIGAVIVKDKKYFVSAGYNGPTSGSAHCDELLYRENLFGLYTKDTGKDVNEEALRTIDTCPRRFMGFPPLSGAGYIYCQAAHAERNAVDMAARLGHATDGCMMYMDCGIPCLECAKSVINAGVKAIVVTEMKNYANYGLTGEDLFRAAGVKIRPYNTEFCDNCDGIGFIPILDIMHDGAVAKSTCPLCLGKGYIDESFGD